VVILEDLRFNSTSKAQDYLGRSRLLPNGKLGWYRIISENTKEKTSPYKPASSVIIYEDPRSDRRLILG